MYRCGEEAGHLPAIQGQLFLKGVWQMEIEKNRIMPKKLLPYVLGGAAVIALSVLSYFFILSTQPKEVTLTLDGVTQSYQTMASNVKQFLKEQNIKISDADILAPAAETPITKDLNIQVKLSWAIPVTADGQTKKVRTVERSVDKILQAAGIELRKQDRVEPALTATVTPSTNIVVTRVDEKVVQVEQRVPYQEIRQADSSLAKGQSRVLQEGKEGIARLHYKLTLVDGKEVSRELIKTDVVNAKRDRVLAYGTGTPLLASRGGAVDRARQVLSNVTLTAYSADAGGGHGRTATGVRATEGRTVAVDPNVIPLGWWVYIEGVGYRRAEDTGGAIKGSIIDVYIESSSEARRFGRKRGKTVYIIGPKKPEE
jgi:uncharacterized protein YabE (DUF348 family)